MADIRPFIPDFTAFGNINPSNGTYFRKIVPEINKHEKFSHPVYPVTCNRPFPG